MFQKTIILSIFISLLILVSCKKDKGSSPDGSPIDLQGIKAEYMGNISYNVYSETKFDIWMPDSKNPTGLLIYIHGGGFTGGDKSVVYEKDKWDFPTEIRTLLINGIAVASINYRLLKQSGEDEGIIKCFNDSRRALQYIRFHADVYNIDKTKIVLSGTSAGAGIALWIGVNDDMQDPLNSDSVLWESTKVNGLAIRETQCSYNIEDKWINEVFVDYGISWNDFLSANEDRIFQLYGVANLTEYESPATDSYRSSVDMLEFFTFDDPDIWAENILTKVQAPTTSGIANHHAFHVREIKEKADLMGIDNICYYGMDPIIYSDATKESYIGFIVRNTN